MEELLLSANECKLDEPLVPGPSSFEDETVTEKLKRYKSPSTIKFRQN
jgi:hypothetical protein